MSGNLARSDGGMCVCVLGGGGGWRLTKAKGVRQARHEMKQHTQVSGSLPGWGPCGGQL